MFLNHCALETRKLGHKTYRTLRQSISSLLIILLATSDSESPTSAVFELCYPAGVFNYVTRISL